MTASEDLQPGVDADELWLQPEPQERRVAAPMLAAARDHLGERVVIHIIGGMQVPGRLYAIDEDDGTLVVTAGENTYHVALHAVAVLVTS